MDSASPFADRLAFTLPEFTRCSWASERARLAWEPRLDRIRQAWQQTEWLSIVEHVRSCALVGLSQRELAATVPRWSANRLSAASVQVSQRDDYPGITFAVVGNLAMVNRAREAWAARDDDELGSMLGYPECCRNFFREVWVAQQMVDTTWPMATNTIRPSSPGRAVVSAGESALANILWRWVGVRAVPHLPCRFDCRETIEFANRLLAVAENRGFTEESHWIREILTWPVEWSALHGIAEVKSPIMKISTRTDATASKYVVHWRGTGYPGEGASGLAFPYRSTVQLTVRAGARPPGDRDVVAEPASLTAKDWYYQDNGFASLAAMRKLHEPLLELGRRAVAGSTGNVLDLGCGNGALLAEICAVRPGLIPFGVDKNQRALAHARRLLPEHAANFRHGDLFDCDIWDESSGFILTLLMAGRLLEVERPAATQLIDRVLTRSAAVLVYLYPGWGGTSLSSVAAELGLVLASPAGATAGLLSRDALPRT
jgi:Methyltransferase domain